MTPCHYFTENQKLSSCFSSRVACSKKAISTAMADRARTEFKDIWRKMGDEEKKAAVHEEVKRMNQLPANSAFASHRLRVLHKILQLMSLQRTASNERELEVLFAGLSL